MKNTMTDRTRGTRKAVAMLFSHAKNSGVTLQECKDGFRLADQSKDNGWRGCGNKALRRQGEEFGSYRCGCDVCVVYGGDCSNVMYQEARREEHDAQRGKKTRLSRRAPFYRVCKKALAGEWCNGQCEYTLKVLVAGV